MIRYPKINHQLRHIGSPKGKKFEEFVQQLLKRVFPDALIEHTGGVNDSGRDVVVHNSGPLNEKYVFQVKYRGTVNNNKLHRIGSNKIQQYSRHALKNEINCAAVVTNSGFTKEARSCAREDNLELINGKRLVDLLIRYQATDVLDEYYSQPDITHIDEMLTLIRKLGGIDTKNEDFDSHKLLIDHSAKHPLPADSMTVDDLYATAIRRLFELSILDKDDLPIPVTVCGSQSLIYDKVNHTGREPVDITSIIELIPDVYLNVPQDTKIKAKTLTTIGVICVNKNQNSGSVSAQKIIPELKYHAEVTPGPLST